MADRVAVLNEGHLEQLGTPEEIYRSPATRFVAEFVGSPKINLIEGRVERHVLIPFGLSMMNNALREHEGNVSIGLRPEAIRIAADGAYAAKVTGCEYLGDSYCVSLAFKDIPIVVSGAQHQMQEGDSVAFGFDQDDLYFFDCRSGHRLN
jgi:multiple sugar transport system ATP-binding protein